MYAQPSLSLSTVSEEEETGDITLTVSPENGAEFPEGAMVVINGLEGYAPDTTLSTPRALVVTVPNETRAVGVYAVQVRYSDGRVTAPALLEITAVEEPPEEP